MNLPGLTREERVFLNRVANEYLNDTLPNPEQTRVDVSRLITLAANLSDTVEKLLKEQRP